MPRRGGAAGHGLSAALAGAATLAAAAPAAALPLRPLGATTPLADERLSDERTLTRWASAITAASVRAGPSTRARTVARLRWSTEQGRPEVYLVLEARRAGPARRVWVRVRLPGRPNGRSGWVRREALADLHAVTTQLTVDRARLIATLRRDGRVVWRSPVGVGAPGTATPPGRFWVRERLRNLRGSPLYGPWAFGTSAYAPTLTDWPAGGVIGIHGTDRPELIPGRPSHGCIRVPNAAVRRLARLMPVGTPVRIV